LVVLAATFLVSLTFLVSTFFSTFVSEGVLLASDSTIAAFSAFS